MLKLSAAILLDSWETALAQQPIERGLTLLALALPETPRSQLSSLPIGRRDAHLLTLRQQLFGARLNSLALCPQCGEQLELNFAVDEIRVPTAITQTQPLHLQTEHYKGTARLPNSADLLAIANIRDPAAARQQLLRRCLISDEQGSSSNLEREDIRLSEELIGQILAQMAEADPQGDVQLALACPNCGHEWQMPFDILSYLWQEINDWAQRTLHEVHLLASAYGWREADILAQSAQRRHFYLALIGKG